MRIPRIEPPVLRAKMRNMDGKAWLRTAVVGDSIVVAEGQDIGGNGGAITDTVVLSYALNYCGELEDMRRMIASARRMARKRVVAVARACDSGQELAERMVEMGVPPSDLGISNLTNREIACLAPDSIALLRNIMRMHVRNAEIDSMTEAQHYAQVVRKSPILPDIRGELPSRFTSRVLDAGLIWLCE